MKRHSDAHRLLLILSLGTIALIVSLWVIVIVGFIRTHPALGPIPASNRVSVFVWIESTTDPSENGIEISVNPGYAVGSDTFTCEQVELRADFNGHGPVLWIGQRGLPAFPLDGHYECDYQHDKQHTTFAIPVDHAPMILVPQPGQTVYHTPLMVRFSPSAQEAELKITVTSGSWSLIPDTDAFVNTDQILVNANELNGAPNGPATLAISVTTRGTVSQTAFGHVAYQEKLASNIPITIAP